MTDKILEYIKKNRVSTTELADCMGKQGLIENAIPLNKKHFIAGKVHYSYCDDESNWNVHKTIQSVPDNSVVFVDDLGSNNRAIFGDLVAKYLFISASSWSSNKWKNKRCSYINKRKLSNLVKWCKSSGMF